MPRGQDNVIQEKECVMGEGSSVAENLLGMLFGNMRGNKTRRGRRRELVRGDVICVEDSFLKRYGIWNGEKVIFYGKDSKGVYRVHKRLLPDFMQDAESISICEFPEKYGRPTEWEQPVSFASVFAPPTRYRQLLEHLLKARKYKRYSHEETASRAESRLGTDGYGTSEHFALWCKTGIAESHELESIRDFWERIIVY